MKNDNGYNCFLNSGDTEGLIQSKESPKNESKFQRPYVFYCVMTLSILFFTLAFAASELFALFFSDGDIGNMVLTKLFGSDASGGKNIQEIMLGQSFVDLSFGKGNTENESSTDSTTAPNDSATTAKPDDSNPPTPESSIKVPSDSAAPDDIYAYYPENIPNGMMGIIPLDLGLTEYGNDYIHNQSSFSPNTDGLENIKVSVSPDTVYPTGGPLVLVVHTHGTESYIAEGISWYDPSSEVARSSDTSENVVYIGKIIADTLNSKGIPTVHCEIMHDIEGYSGSYERSAETVKKYLSEYPSIQYVIDVHRDAIVRSTGELVRPVISSESGSAAQVMCVIGTGGTDSEIPTWQNNLALAQKLREELNGENKGICRPACLRDSSYNQQYSTYSLLLEMGAAGNTLKEAEITAVLVANALSKIITE